LGSCSPWISSTWGLEIPGIDAVKIAQGYGTKAWDVDHPEQPAPVLKQAFALAEPCLINVSVRKGGQSCMGMDRSVNPPSY